MGIMDRLMGRAEATAGRAGRTAKPRRKSTARGTGRTTARTAGRTAAGRRTGRAGTPSGGLTRVLNSITRRH